MNVIDRYREGEPVELCEGRAADAGGTCRRRRERGARRACHGGDRQHGAHHARRLHSPITWSIWWWAVSTPRASWEGLDDIEDIYVCDQGTRASVLLSCHHADFFAAGCRDGSLVLHGQPRL